MPAQLLALTDGPSILLDKPILLLGRHAECDVQLNSRKVSRRHCCLAIIKDYLIVRDLGSTNGIRINGERVPEGKLKAGDELTIGNFRYQVYLEGLAPSMVMPPKSAKNDVRKQSEESLLEASDEPMALEEGNVKQKVVSAKSPKPAPAIKLIPFDDDDSFVLPEKLRSVPPPDQRGN